MKSILSALCAAFAVCACTTSSGPATAWGKEGVSMLDYRLDGGQCAVIAATVPADSNGDKAAGGLSGQNETTRLPQGGSGDSTASSGATGSAFPTGGGGMYRDNTNVDTVSRAANQSQAAEVANNKARTARLKGCLTERGYTEFTLTPEQRAKLATLPEGSAERREYLHKLGTDAAVLKSQAVPRQGS
jgi:hypothetical protein